MNELLTKAPLSANARILMDCLNVYNTPGKASVILGEDFPLALNEALTLAERGYPELLEKLLSMVDFL